MADVGDGQWLHCFPKLGDRQVGLGWDREGCAPRTMYFWAGGMERPTVCLGGPLPKKRVALRASPA